MSKKIWIAGVLTLAVALVAAGAVAAAPVADPQGPGGDPQGQQAGPGQNGPRGGFPQVSGEVTAIGDGQLTVQVNEDVEVTVLVSDATHYFGSLDGFADLAVGDDVVISGMPDMQGRPDGLPAEQGAPSDGADPKDAPNAAPGDAQGQPEPGAHSLEAGLIALSDELSVDNHAEGQVTEVSSSSLTIQSRDGESLTFTVNSDTVFISHDDALQSVSDLQAGDHVQLVYDDAASGTPVAVLITLGGGAPDGTGPNGSQNGAPQQNNNAPDGSQQGTGAQG